MEKIILLIFSNALLCGSDSAVAKCNECHNRFLAPSYKKVYKRYLLKYSSKARVEKAMIDFLKAPSEDKSVMSDGMKRRFDPDEHPLFNNDMRVKAVRYIVEQEDMLKRFKKLP